MTSMNNEVIENLSALVERSFTGVLGTVDEKLEAEKCI